MRVERSIQNKRIGCSDQTAISLLVFPDLALPPQYYLYLIFRLRARLPLLLLASLFFQLAGKLISASSSQAIMLKPFDLLMQDMIVG
mmetsp:Transcript_16587/g.37890  ORF Transcript_16587/g.37890 Transcript_16587/m.37890 type:complete len:87 (+) Transcript_16587:1164-1424(+)